MTFADMVLAHGIIERLGQDATLHVLDVLEGDAALELHATQVLIELVQTLEYELGAAEAAVRELQAVLTSVRSKAEISIEA